MNLRGKYTQSTVEVVCERLRHGEGLPCRDTMMNWLDSDRCGFRERSLESKRIVAFLHAGQLMDEAGDDSHDYFVDEHGIEKPNHVGVQRSRLICDSIK